MNMLLELAAECEVATGPSRRIDLGIMRYAMNIGGPAENAAHYTASLDAAMTLVPEGWGWNVNQPNEKAIASGLLKERTPVRGEVEYGCDQRLIVAGATPALALTAAALRARASSQDHSLHGEGGL